MDYLFLKSIDFCSSRQLNYWLVNIHLLYNPVAFMGVCLFIYLFIWLHQVLVVARRLSSCGTQAPECAGSVVAVHGLSCPAACGILVP